MAIIIVTIDYVTSLHHVYTVLSSAGSVTQCTALVCLRFLYWLVSKKITEGSNLAYIGR